MKMDNEMTMAFAFHKWMVEKGWHEYASQSQKGFYYRSRDFHQWPPDETASEQELCLMFKGFYDGKG